MDLSIRKETIPEKTGLFRDQIDKSWWCDKLSVLSPLSFLNAVSWNADASMDNKTYFDALLFPKNPTDPTQSNEEFVKIDKKRHSSVTGILEELSVKALFGTYASNAGLGGRMVDRRPDFIKENKCTGDVNMNATWPKLLKEAKG